jgi:methyltransferase
VIEAFRTEWLLAGYLAITTVQRFGELALARHNTRWLRARGAREYGRGHFPAIVALHTLLPIALTAEVLLLHTRPGTLAPLWLGLWVAAQALRYSAVRALGPFWNVRVLVVPGAPLVRRGPYRWLAHPNYVAVVTEMFAGPMLLGAWRTALVFSLLDLLVLRIRVRCEDQALALASGADAPAGTGGGSAP